MAVPRNRTSKSKSLSRRSHSALGQTSKAQCPNCGNSHPHHTICDGCGYYSGRLVSSEKAE